MTLNFPEKSNQAAPSASCRGAFFFLFAPETLFLTKIKEYMESVIEQKKVLKSGRKSAIKVPDYLIYEVVGGKPIYYKGYKDVLSKTKTFEEIRLSNQLQAGLKAALTAELGASLGENKYQIAVGKLGLLLPNRGKRCADLAIFSRENWNWQPKFSNLPPEVILEIDVQAELEGITEMDYISTKIKDYLDFGVKKVIWIFTKQQLVFVATQQLPWLTYDWSTEIEVVEGVGFRLDDIVKP